MMNQTAAMDGTAVVDGLLEGVKHEAGMGGATDPPAHDIASVDVDHEGYIGEPSPRRHIGKIGDPEPVGRRSMELAVNVIERARSGLVADRGAHWLAPNDTLQAEFPHQSLHRASRNIEPSPLQIGTPSWR